MGRKRKNDDAGGGLFMGDQPRLFDKSVEQTLMEAKHVECLGITFPSDDARRAFFLDKLREKLKDPAFRKTEGFPIGVDEDILALSDPPYYTACPNPFIEDFVKCHGNPYTQNTDQYERDVNGGQEGRHFGGAVAPGRHELMAEKAYGGEGAPGEHGGERRMAARGA